MNKNKNQPFAENKQQVPAEGRRAATCLRELKLGDVELLHDLISEYIGGGEKPAPPTALLISSRPGFEIDHVVEHMLVGNLGSAI